MQMREVVTGDVGKCGCGRSPTGKCIGWHGLSESQFKAEMAKYIAEQSKTPSGTTTQVLHG